MDSDSAKAFEEWIINEVAQGRRLIRETGDAEAVWDASWRASGRWHRLAALRDAEKVALENKTFGGFLITNRIRALIAVEEKEQTIEAFNVTPHTETPGPITGTEREVPWRVGEKGNEEHGRNS